MSSLRCAIVVGTVMLPMFTAAVNAEPSLSLDGDSVSSLPIASPAGPGDVLEAKPGNPPPNLGFPSIKILASDLGIDSPLGLNVLTPDLDALSYNRVLPLGFSFGLRQTNPAGFNRQVKVYFSVDRGALGAANTAVAGETFLFADDKRVRFAAEPAADVFTSALNGANSRVYDGDGYDGYGANDQPLVAPVPGLGLNEGLMTNIQNFIPPITANPPTNNLDALDLRPAPNRLSLTPVFFSVDVGGAALLSSNITDGVNLGAVSGADVLVSPMNGTFSVYATAEQLGLATVMPAEPLGNGEINRTLNNLDALVVFDDGVLVGGMPVFNPATDVVLFSLDQASVLVHEDGLLGRLAPPAFLAGDILISSPVAGGAPSVLATAEELGLFVFIEDPILGQSEPIRVYSDELDALDVTVVP